MPNKPTFYRESFTSTITKEDLEGWGIEGAQFEDEITLTFDPDQYVSEDFIIKVEDGKVSFAYLSRDDSGEEYDWDEGVIFDTFRSQEAKDKRMAELKDEGYEVYSIEEYRHSGSAFAFENEGNFPDRQWDVMPNSLLALPKGEFTNPEASARAMIENYNQYISGQVYGICEATFDIESGDELETEECWNYIGEDHAMSELISQYGSPDDRKEYALNWIKEAGFDEDGKLKAHFSSCLPGATVDDIYKATNTYFSECGITKEEIEAIASPQEPERNARPRMR